MKIGILGTRGIPNNHGGFEQFAEYLSKGLVEQGHDVVVYNGSDHPFKDHTLSGVKIIRKWNPENLFGTFAQFLFDLLCILDSRKRGFDIILQLGYTSSSVFFNLHPKSSEVVTNMDGLEWKRSKYHPLIRKFLKFSERRAIRKSDFLVSDSIGIKDYLKKNYSIESEYIAYGSEVAGQFDDNIFNELKLQKVSYDLLIARMEPENNIEMVIQGHLNCPTSNNLIVVGGLKTPYAKYLLSKYTNGKIIFVGGIYNREKLDALRYESALYFHGHSCGGTNPSLLEAMGSNTLICAHENIFNKSILNENALYFKSVQDVENICRTVKKEDHLNKIIYNSENIKNNFSITKIVLQYEVLFYKVINS